jgi:hypothetical protein
MVPRDLYDYTVKETGVRFESHGFGNLLVKITEHMEANAIPVPENLAGIVEEDWCKRREDWCQDSEAPRRKDVTKGEWNSLKELISKVAIGGADALATISKALGIDCSTCNARHKIIREMRRLGFVETMRRLKETLHA